MNYITRGKKKSCMIYSYALELVGFTHKHRRRSHTTAHTSVSHKTQTQITHNCTYIGFTHKHRRRSHTTAHTYCHSINQHSLSLSPQMQTTTWTPTLKTSGKQPLFLDLHFPISNSNQSRNDRQLQPKVRKKRQTTHAPPLPLCLCWDGAQCAETSSLGDGFK